MIQLLAIDGAEKDARAVEHGQVVVDEGLLHGQTTRVYAIPDDHPVGTAGAHRPAILSRLFGAQDLGVESGGAEGLDVTRELPDEIGAGCPHRHEERHLLFAAGREDGLHVDVVGVGIGEAEGVLDGIPRRATRLDRYRLSADFALGRFGLFVG